MILIGIYLALHQNIVLHQQVQVRTGHMHGLIFAEQSLRLHAGE
jgi:hypothetical protein